MHISEGILSAPVLASGGALTAIGTAIGLSRTDYEKLPLVALLAAVFFLASFVHVPIGPAAAHLILSGVCGLLLGWAAFPAVLVGLALQAILFQYGGITTLGVNTFNIASPAVLMGFLCRRFLNASLVVRTTFEFLAGAGSIFLSGILTALSLLFTGQSFDIAAKIIVLAHIPVMIAEGLITVFIAEFLRNIRPQMILENQK